MQALRQLLITLGIQVSGKEKLDAVDESAKNATRSITTLAGAIAGLGILKGVTSFITGMVDEGAKLADTANRLGVSTQDLQQFSYAANMVGVNTQQAGNALRFFNRHLGLAELGNKTAAKDFALLGVNIRDANGKLKPTADLLPEVADGFVKLKDDAERTEFTVKLFGRSGTGLIPILRDGSAGLRAFYTEFMDLGGGIREDAVVALKEADRGVTRLGLAFSVMRSRMVLQMLPAFEWGLAAISKFMRYMGDFADKTLLAKTALIALVGAGIVLLSPFLLAIAPIVAEMTLLYLVFDDIFTMFAGGNSLIGDFIDTLYGKGAHQTFVADVKKEWEGFLDWVRDTGIPFIKDFGRMLSWAFTSSLPEMRMWADGMKALVEVLLGVGGAVNALLSGDWKGFDKSAGKGLSSAWHSLIGGKTDDEMNKEAKQRAYDEQRNNLIGASVYGSTPTTLTAPATSRGSSTTNVKGAPVIQGDLNITVSTQATDAQGTADATKEAFTSATEATQSRRDHADISSVLPGGN